MGSLTVAQILSEGGLQAGDTGKINRARVDLLAWLRSQYRGFLWPFLKRELTGAALGVGSTSFTLGAYAGGVTQQLQRVNDPLTVYTPDFSMRGKVRVMTDYGDSVMEPLIPGDPNFPKGMPTLCRITHTGVVGQRKIDFNAQADRNYLLKISYYMLPSDPGDSEVPLYENDRTMIQAVASFVLKYNKAENYMIEADLLRSMVLEDRLKYGTEPGMNDMLPLDPKVFK